MKKTKHILLALVCLLATALLTVGCTADTQAPEEIPEGNSASDAATSLVTDALQVETEPVAESESASQETEGAALGESVCTPSDLGFNSGSYSVAINDHVFYALDDGIYMMFEGQETMLCSGSFQDCNLCTDGTLLYAVDHQSGNVMQLDLTDGSVEALFNVGSTADVLGASEDVLYIGRQKDENDFWGYDLCSYSLDGVMQEGLGEDLYVSMEDGILCCTDFRTDVGITPFRAYDRDGKLMVEVNGILNYSVQNGTVYYWALREGNTIEDLVGDNNGEIVFYRVDSNGGTTELKTFEGMPSGITLCDDVLYVNGHFYSLENGAELTGGIYDKMLASGDVNSMIPGKDSNGKWYCFDSIGLSIFRENDNGEMVDCGKAAQGANFYYLCGDWAYSLSYSGTQMYACYVPVQ